MVMPYPAYLISKHFNEFFDCISLSVGRRWSWTSGRLWTENIGVKV